MSLNETADLSISPRQAEEHADFEAAVQSADAAHDRRIRHVKRIKHSEIIADAHNVRTQSDADSITELAGSISEIGLLEPIQVWWSEGARRYVILAGHRRFQANVQAGRDSIDASVVDPSPEHMLLIQQMAANVCRKDLSIGEMYDAIERYQALTGKNDSMTALKLGMSKPRMSFIKGFGGLLPAVQKLVREGRIGISSLPGLARLKTDEQLEFAEALANGRITTREFQSKVYELTGKRARKPVTPRVSIRTEGTTVTSSSIDDLRTTVDSLRRRLKTAESLEDLADGFRKKPGKQPEGKGREARQQPDTDKDAKHPEEDTPPDVAT